MDNQRAEEEERQPPVVNELDLTPMMGPMFLWALISILTLVLGIPLENAIR